MKENLTQINSISNNNNEENTININQNLNSEDQKKNLNPKPNCQMCKIKESIYKCPRCQIRTCCLICVKQHKNRYKCTGIRDKFSKKSIKDFTENDFVRDMKFLNATINDTNQIEKKCFNLTEDTKPESISGNLQEESNFTKDRKILLIF